MSIAWQLSLTGSLPGPAARPEPERVRLAGGAWIEHAPGWLDRPDEAMDELLAGAPWDQRQRHLYDRLVDEPRLTAWWPLVPTAGPPAGLPPRFLAVGAALAERYGVAFDSVGANLYRDGRDSVAWHGDTIRRTLAEAVVAIVSLGQRRPLLLRPTGGGPSRRYDLGAGDLFVMGGTAQRTWQHCVPKVRAAGTRISVTYRHSS